MRRTLLYLGIIIAMAGITFGLKVSAQQGEKEAIVKFNKAELEALYQIVDDAAVPGQVRKPILQKLEMSYRSTFAVQPQTMKDTSKPKRN